MMLPTRVRPLARLAQLATAALLLSSLSCLNDSPTAGGKQAGSLGIRMQLGQDAVNNQLDITVSYLRHGEPDRRQLTQKTEPLHEGQTQVALPVDLGPCLSDRSHVRGVTRGCSLEVTVRLLDPAGTLIQEFDPVPVEADPGGETRTPLLVIGTPVAAVRITPNPDSLYVGASKTLVAAAFDANDQLIPGRAFQWASSVGGIAEIDQTGTVVGRVAGQVTITATAVGTTKSGSADLTVLAPVATVTLAPPGPLTMVLGTNQAVAATLKDAANTVLNGRVVTWTSSNPAVVDFAAPSLTGAVTLVAKTVGGPVTITATSETKTATMQVTVIAVPVDHLTLTAPVSTLVVGQTTQLTATPFDAANNALVGRVVSFTSSDNAVATVSGTGLVTAVAPGPVTITATSEGKSATVTLTVTAAVSGLAFDFEQGAPGARWSSQSIATTPSGRKFLGEFDNQTVSLDLNNLAAHSRVEVSFDLYIMKTWDGGPSSTGCCLPDFWSIGVNGTDLLKTTFTPFNEQSFPAPYDGTTKYPATTGASERGTLGFSGGQDAVYHLTFVIPHTGGPLRVDFSGAGLQGAADESWGLDNVTVRLDPAAVTTVAIGGAPTGAILPGATAQLTATPKAGGTAVDRRVTWQSSDPTVATVDRYLGLVTAVAPGTATITVTAEDAPAVSGSVQIAVGGGLRIGGWDAARGGTQYNFLSGSLYGVARAQITQSFPGATFVPVNTLTAQSLAGLDVVVLTVLSSTGTVVTPLSTAEQQALYDYVRGGGDVILLTDATDDQQLPGYRATNTSFLAPFGLTTDGWQQGTYGVTVPTPSASALTSGRFGTVSGFTQGDGGAYTNLGPFARSLASNNLGPALAVIDRGRIGAGSGTVVAESDVAVWFDQNMGGGNTALLLNAIDFGRAGPTVPAAVFRISLSPSPLALGAGQTQQLTPSLIDADGNTLGGRVVTYQTSDPAVVTVDNTGLVTAVGAGSATITATSDQVKTTLAVTVTGPVLVPGNGKVVVNADEWTLSDNGFNSASSTGQFARNLAAWFTGGTPGRFLAYSNNFGLTGGQLAQTMQTAGHSWTVGTSQPFTLQTLQQYNAVFVGGDFVDQQVLTQYVQAGGSVYVMAGTGNGSGGGEAAAWNTFLGAFGLRYEPTYAFTGVAPIASAHPTLVGVPSLYYNLGNPVSVTGSAGAKAGILATDGTNGLIGAYDGVGPVMQRSAASAAFSVQAGGAAPPPQTVTITNAGGGTLDHLSVGPITYGAGEPTGWLAATLNNTAAPAQLTLAPTAAVSGLAAGVYTASVPVVGSSLNSPQTVSVTLTVTAATVPVARVSVSPPASSLLIGQTVQLAATTYDANGNALVGRIVTWSSSDANVATVDQTGLVTGVATGGPVTITATSETVPGTASVTVAASFTRTWTGVSSVAWSDPNSWSPAGVPGPRDAVVLTSGANNQRSPVLDVDATVGSVVMSDPLGLLSFGGHTLTVAGDFTTAPNGGALAMSNAADRLIVGGNATFNGNSTAPSAGEIHVRGNFVQREAQTPASFAPTGSSRVVLDGTGDQSVDFGRPDASRFADLVIDKPSGAVDLLTTVTARNVSIASATTVSTSNGNGALGATGDITAAAGSAIVLPTVAVAGVLAPGAYDVGLTAFAGQTLQSIPSNIPYRNVTVTGTAAPGGPAPLVIGNELRVERVDVAGVPAGAALFLTNGLTTVQGNLTVARGGVLDMQHAADQLVVVGAATFSGAASTGHLVDGVLELRGDFTQTAAGGSDASFSASGSHLTRFNGRGTQTIRFDTPGAGGSGSSFNILQLMNGVTLASNVFAGGRLISQGTDEFVTGNGNELEVNGLDVDNLTFDHVLLTSATNGGTPATVLRLSTVYFQNYDPAETQIIIKHPGAATPFVFDDLHFATTPTTGTLLLAEDEAPGDGVPLVINVTNSRPAVGAQYVQTINGAVVNWGVVTPTVKTWIGGVGANPADWSDPANWSPGGVPTAAEDAFIGPTASGAMPVLTADAAAHTVTVDGSGASLDLGGHTLAVTLLTLQNSAKLVMTNAADQLDIATRLVLGPNAFTRSRDITAGTITIGEGITDASGQTAIFEPSGTNKVVFTGAATGTTTLQMEFSGRVKLNDVELTGGSTFRIVEGPTSGRCYMLMRAFTVSVPAQVDLCTTSQGTLGFVEIYGALSTVAGSSVTADFLRISSRQGTSLVDGSFSPRTTQFYGGSAVGTQLLKPGLAYQQVIIQNGLSMFTGPGATDVAGDLLILNNAQLQNPQGHTVTVHNDLRILAGGTLDNQGAVYYQNNFSNQGAVLGNQPLKLGQVIALGQNTLSLTTTQSAGPTSGTIDIQNGGSVALTGLAVGTITYGAGEPAGWLSGVITNAPPTATTPATLTLTANPAGVPIGGPYTATVPVEAPGASNTPQTVTVTFTVSGGLLRTWTGGSFDWNTANRWSPAGIPGAQDTVVIPNTVSGTPTLSTNVTVGRLVVQPNVVQLLNNFTLTTDAADVQGQVSNGTVVLTGAGGSVRGTFANLTTSAGNPLILVGPTTATGNLSINGGLAVNGQPLTVNGALTVNTGGSLRMQSAADLVVVGGAATFNGGTGATTEQLTAGELRVGGKLSVGGTSPTAFFATRGHVVRMTNTTSQQQNLEVSNPAGAQFGDLDAGSGPGTFAFFSPNTNPLLILGDFTSRRTVMNAGNVVHIAGNADLGTSFLNNTNGGVFQVAGNLTSGAMGGTGDLDVGGNITSNFTSPNSVSQNSITVGGTITLPVQAYQVGTTTFTGALTGGSVTLPQLPFQTLVIPQGVVATLSARLPSVSNLVVSGKLVLNGHLLNAGNSITTVAGTPGAIRMTNPLDSLITSGVATFSGGSDNDPNDAMTAGIVQIGHLSGHGLVVNGGQYAYFAGPAHHTQFIGFANPGSITMSSGRIGSLDIANSNAGGITANTDLTIAGNLTVGMLTGQFASSGRFVVPAGRRVSVGGNVVVQNGSNSRLDIKGVVQYAGTFTNTSGAAAVPNNQPVPTTKLVDIVQLSFSPTPADVALGGTVTWNNGQNSFAVHNVVFSQDNPTLPTSALPADIANFTNNPPTQRSATFPMTGVTVTPGTPVVVNYRCTIHGFTGQVRVH